METKSKLRTLQLILYNSIEENDEDEIMVANNGHNNNNKQIKYFHTMNSIFQFLTLPHCLNAH